MLSNVHSLGCSKSVFTSLLGHVSIGAFGNRAVLMEHVDDEGRQAAKLVRSELIRLRNRRPLPVPAGLHRLPTSAPISAAPGVCRP
jgi:hypothetical protein